MVSIIQSMIGAKYIIFQKSDVKTHQWAKHLLAYGIDADGVEGSPMKAPLFVLQKIVKGKKPAAYFVRYLNDYPNLLRTLLRFASEIVLVIVCAVFHVRIGWILHNVDKESSEYWPSLSRWRRNLFRCASHRIFVTDELLISSARDRFPNVELDWLPFGIEVDAQTNAGTSGDIEKRISSFRRKLESETGCHALIGLCVTSMSDKCIHLTKGPEIVKNFATDKQVVGLVYIGDFSGAGSDWKKRGEVLVQNNCICVIDKKIIVDEENLSVHIDFIYRALSDSSVAYSVYRAAAVGKPIVTHQCGFISDLARVYGIGIVADEVDITTFFKFFHDWNSCRWESFLRTRSWFIAAGKISRFVTA